VFGISEVGDEQGFAIGRFTMKSLIVSVPLIGNYAGNGFNDKASGFLETRKRVSFLSVASDPLFIIECHFVRSYVALQRPHSMGDRPLLWSI
jgi:hypothetical protein